jgi:hypothetical protein
MLPPQEQVDGRRWRCGVLQENVAMILKCLFYSLLTMLFVEMALYYFYQHALGPLWPAIDRSAFLRAGLLLGAALAVFCWRDGAAMPASRAEGMLYACMIPPTVVFVGCGVVFLAVALITWTDPDRYQEIIVGLIATAGAVGLINALRLELRMLVVDLRAGRGF